VSLHLLFPPRADNSWPCAVPETCIADFRFVPLDSPERMADEALAMETRLPERIAACRLGAARYYSIRDAASGERLALLELRPDKHGAWKPSELKDPANRDVDDLAVCLAASWLAFEYEKRDRRRREARHPGVVIALRRLMPVMATAGLTP
jgi:hypothetical protein